jgi:hypothetical protein
MTGDRHKHASAFIRWIDAFMDGAKQTTVKGKHRIPSMIGDKRRERRRRRHEALKGGTP